MPIEVKTFTNYKPAHLLINVIITFFIELKFDITLFLTNYRIFVSIWHSQVTLLKNIDIQKGLVNGARGVVVGFEPGIPGLFDTLVDSW